MKSCLPMRLSIAALLATLLAGCTPWATRGEQTQRASVVEHLFTNDKESTMTPDARTTPRLPLRVGPAFAPGSAGPAQGPKMPA